METKTYSEELPRNIGVETNIQTQDAELWMHLERLLAGECLLEPVEPSTEPAIQTPIAKVEDEQPLADLLPPNEPEVSTTQAERSQKAKEIAAAVELAKTGDFEAFGVVYAQYASAIKNYICTYTDPDSAGDITQDTFIKAFKNIQDFTDRGYGIKPWLYRIAHNTFINSRRRTSKYDVVDMSDRANTIISPENTEATAIGQAMIRLVLGQLSPDRREAMLCVVMGGEDPTEYAERHNISLNTVRTRICRARKDLAELREAGELEEVA